MSGPSSAQVERHPPIEAVGLAKTYPGGVKALRGPGLRLERGEIAGVIGANGSGKTTLLRILAGCLRPDDGEVRIYGCAADSRETRSRIGYVTQDAALDPEMTAAETLALFAVLHGMDGRKSSLRQEEMTKIFGLGGWTRKRAASLSGGMRQRLHLGLGFLHGPDLALLDEPLAALDPDGREAFWKHLVSRAGQGGSTLLSIHDLQAAAEKCTRIIMMAEGRILADAAPRELIAAHGSTVWEGTLTRPSTDAEALGQRLSALREVSKVETDGTGVLLRFAGEGPEDAVILAVLAESQVEIGVYQRRRPDLASAYRNLSGKEASGPGGGQGRGRRRGMGHHG